jgi:hypothetical protein
MLFVPTDELAWFDIIGPPFIVPYPPTVLWELTIWLGYPTTLFTTLPLPPLPPDKGGGGGMFMPL